MSEKPNGGCDICGAPSVVHLSANGPDGQPDENAPTESYCFEHLPEDVKRQIPFGPHRTAAEEADYLRKKLAEVDKLPDPALRAVVRAELERTIADIEAGRRRFGQPG